MTVFHYTGLNPAGCSVAGSLEALNEALAYERLAAEGILPVSLGVGLKAEETPARAARRPWALQRRRVPVGVLTVFARELATFINADVPLLEALGVLRRQETHPVLRAVLDDVYARVQAGDAFSKALAAHPRLFSSLLVSMVRVGETGGLLGRVLEQMAAWMEHEDEVRGEIRSAMAYPLMIVALGIVTVIVLVSFVLPRITIIFAGMEADLPLPTRILMGTAGFMGRWWWLTLLGAGLAALAVARGLKTATGRQWRDRAALHLPLFGALARKASVARLSRACAAMLASGVPLMDALRVLKGIAGNALMAATVEQTIEGVTRGQSLARTLGQSPYFPASVVHLLGVGERSGRLSEMFERVAETFERQMRQQIKILLNLLSPALIIVLAVVVAFIAISILLPIFRMNQLMR